MNEDTQKNWWEAGATADDAEAPAHQEASATKPMDAEVSMNDPVAQVGDEEEEPAEESRQLWVGPDGQGCRPEYSSTNGMVNVRHMAGAYGVSAGERSPGEYHRDEFPEALRPDMSLGLEDEPKPPKRRRKKASTEQTTKRVSQKPPRTKRKKKQTEEEGDEPSFKSKKQKKLEKSEKKQKKKNARMDNRGSSGSTGISLIKTVICVVFVLSVGIQGMDRITAANALTGTATSFIKNHTERTDKDVTDLEFDGDADVPNDVSSTEAPENGGTDTTADGDSSQEFRYIDAKKLDSKTATDLAVWYLTQFPEGESKNENAYDEFNRWYEQKTSSDSVFSANFNTAIDYVKAHPELLTPSTKEPSSTKENATTTAAPDSTSPSISVGSNQAENTPPPTTTPVPTASPEVISKYSNIDETTLNTFSAAQVANWVYLNFSPDSTTWDYLALSDYYNWLSEKDYTFRNSVNTYLNALGWTGNTN